MRRHVMMPRPAKHIVADGPKRLVVNAKTIDHGFCGVARGVRFINIASGAWVISGRGLLDGQATRLAAWNRVLGGALLNTLALPRGRIRDSDGGRDRYVV